MRAVLRVAHHCLGSFLFRVLLSLGIQNHSLLAPGVLTKQHCGRSPATGAKHRVCVSTILFLPVSCSESFGGLAPDKCLEQRLVCSSAQEIPVMISSLWLLFVISSLSPHLPPLPAGLGPSETHMPSGLSHTTSALSENVLPIISAGPNPVHPFRFLSGVCLREASSSSPKLFFCRLPSVNPVS